MAMKKIFFISIVTACSVLSSGIVTSQRSMGDHYSERAFELTMIAAAILTPLFILWSLEKSRRGSLLFASFVGLGAGSVFGAVLGFVAGFIIGVHSKFPFEFTFPLAVGWFLIWVATGVLFGAVAGAVLLPLGKAVVYGYGEEMVSK